MMDEIGVLDTRRTRGGWVSPSTRSFLDEARQTPGFSLLDFLHGYLYCRWPYLYVGVGTGRHPLVRWAEPLARLVRKLFPSDSHDGKARAAESYHGKVVTTEAACQLVSVGEDVRLEGLEQVIPYRLARDIILKKRSSGPTVGAPSGRSVQLYDMCSYDMDKFREFIQTPGFTEIFDADAIGMDKLLQDEELLLAFAMRFLKQVLFGEMTIPQREGACEARLEKRRARIQERREAEAGGEHVSSRAYDMPTGGDAKPKKD